MKKHFNLIRYISIFLCVIIAASLIVRIDADSYSPEAPIVITGSSNDEVPVTKHPLSFCSDMTAHTVHYTNQLYCIGCDQYYDYFDGISYYGTSPFNFGQIYLDPACLVCETRFEQEYAYLECCFDSETGQCHLCGKTCSHICNEYEIDIIPYNHPLKQASTFPFEPGESYVVNGTCMLCYVKVSES